MDNYFIYLRTYNRIRFAMAKLQKPTNGREIVRMCNVWGAVGGFRLASVRNDDGDDGNAMQTERLSEHGRYTRAILYFPKLIASISKYADFKKRFGSRERANTRNYARARNHTDTLDGISEN